MANIREQQQATLVLMGVIPARVAGYGYGLVWHGAAIVAHFPVWKQDCFRKWEAEVLPHPPDHQECGWNAFDNTPLKFDCLYNAVLEVARPKHEPPTDDQYANAYGVGTGRRSE